MSDLVLPGDIRIALSHLAAYGVAAILEASGWDGIAIHWTRTLDSRAVISIPGRSRQEVAAVVLEHARLRAAVGNWTALTFNGGPGLLSPRITTPKPADGWRELASLRHQAVDTEVRERRWLDLRLIGALGEPAYWRFDKQGGWRPDEGASRWEMKTRNRGEDFVKHRLRKVALYLAKRDEREVLAGLEGTNVRDEAGNDSQDSRTGTGLTPPGPVDNALAWCAFWGLNRLPVVPRLGARSATAGYASADRNGRRRAEWFYLPIPDRPITLARLGALLASASLSTIVKAREPGDVDRAAAARARDWLVAHGAAAIVRFPIWVSDNPSAPERRAALGGVWPLDRGW